MAAPGDVRREQRPLLGTWVQITVAHPEPATRARALAAAWARMQALQALLSRYEPGSAVCALNTAAGGAPLPMPPEVLSALGAAQRMAQDSDGAFDITVGAYGDWGFDRDDPRAPSARALAAARPLVNWRDVQVDARRGSAGLARPGMALDLGGIAKLPILAEAMQALQAQGVSSAMVNGGGDVLCIGGLHGRPWRVGVRHPAAPASLLGVVELDGGVVASSGDYERGFMQGGRYQHHILDPRTGRPTRGLHGVTLVAREVAAVNGLGAALMVVGAREGRHLLTRRAEVDALMAGGGAPWLSAGMQRRLLPA